MKLTCSCDSFLCSLELGVVAVRVLSSAARVALTKAKVFLFPVVNRRRNVNVSHDAGLYFISMSDPLNSTTPVKETRFLN